MGVKDSKDQVTTSIEEITLDTYELLGENQNPVFHSQYGVAHIYPYTLQDQIATHPTKVAYKALILENQFLRVTVLPQLGGRVYSVFDKISQKEVFYKNPTIKFSPLAIRGAFFSGGVEFSFPIAHAPTTAETVNWDFQHREDGSASIIIGGLEHISGLRWTIKLSLYPERCALAQDVQLHNPTPIPGRYHYWTNASTHSDQQTEFIYPLQRVRSYEFAGTTSWPIARLDSVLDQPGLPGMEGVPMWPAERMHDPINFRWEKNMLAQVSIFGRNVDWDYFGAWQHSSNTGYAHFANHQDVSGMKLWSWGQSEVGIVNQSALMDDGALYAETQCGAMETQLDFDFLPPGKTRSWREWWLPLRDIGGMTCASAELGARLHLSPDEDRNSVNLSIGLCPVATIDPAEIELSIPGQTLLRASAKITPRQPWMERIKVEAKTLSSHPLTLTVKNEQGDLLLGYTHDSTPSDDDPINFQPALLPDSADYFYKQGLHHENFDNRTLALESYREAIFISEEHGPSHFQLGLMLLRSADLDAAHHHFRWAADLGINSANYYLGLIAWYLGDKDTAYSRFQAVLPGDPLALAAVRGQVAISFLDNDWERALQLLDKFTSQEHSHHSLELLRGMANLRAGKHDKALTQFSDYLNQDPLNLLAINEISRLDSAHKEIYIEKLDRLLTDDQQYILDLACLYLDLGLKKDAIQILEAKATDWAYAPIFYLLAYIPAPGQEPAAWRNRARQLKPDFVFPSRLWEIIALQDSLAQDGDDYLAKYLLANFYYAHQRYAEAIQLWEESRTGLNSFDVLYRNLGLAYWQHTGDLEKAIRFFETGLELNPGNQDFYFHLDDLYNEEGQDQKRVALLEKIRKLDPIREDLRKRKLAIMVDLNLHDQALEIMTNEDFVPLEMDQSFHNIYVRALLIKAREKLDSGSIEQAIEAYHRALEFPANQGVGQPVSKSNAQILYQLGCAYELLGSYQEAINAWQAAAFEHHKFGEPLYKFVQLSLDKLGRYSEIGFEG